jgi:uncharacterized phage-associated protein
MNNIPTAYCVECGDKVAYRISTRQDTAVVRGVEFSYVEQLAVCPECGAELYVPEVNDANVQAREDAYRIAADLITVDEVNDILQKYNIGAGPLAKVMGFGEVTINRYVSGQLPSREHSEKLREVLNSHVRMAEYLESGKALLSPVAYSKCKSELDRLAELYGNGKIELVTRYFLSKSGDITPMALQKLLYYAQAFYYALFNEELFPDRCQAWAYGPVYPKVYAKYSDYGYDPIRSSVDFSFELNELTTREIGLLDAVINSFGCYSGTKLSSFTHSEQPWFTARGSLSPKDRSSTEISVESIRQYFAMVVEKYHIMNPCDIVKYSSDMYNNVR